jgi:hypothetical protein
MARLSSSGGAAASCTPSTTTHQSLGTFMNSHLFPGSTGRLCLIILSRIPRIVISAFKLPLSIKTHDLQYLITCSIYDTCRATSHHLPTHPFIPPSKLHANCTIPSLRRSLVSSLLRVVSYRTATHGFPFYLTLQTRLILYTSNSACATPSPSLIGNNLRNFISVHISLAPLLVIFTISWTASVMMRPPFFLVILVVYSTGTLFCIILLYIFYIKTPAHTTASCFYQGTFVP